jgi:2-amino-4-hydroxy-6-hydroxymethyldihydropteridine diphosphokinase
MPRCLVAVGSNLGDREPTLRQAIAAIGQLPSTRVLAQSQFRETSPLGGPSGQGPYLNGAVTLSTQLPPVELLQQLRTIEEELGRQRREVWGPRAIDLDLLLYGQEVVVSEFLTLPHPRMTFRPFVLEPAVEIAGDWEHPLLACPLSRLWERLQQGDDYMVLYGGEANVRDWYAGHLLRHYPGLKSVTEMASNSSYAPQVGDTCWLALERAPVLAKAAPRLALFFTRGEKPPVSGVPTLILPNEQREDRLFDVRGAVEGVWPELGGLAKVG